MQPAPIPLEALRHAASAVKGVRLLVLFGSRAREDASETLDWDFGFIGDADPESLRVELSSALGTDAVDIVDLARANALLRYRAARDGRVVLESERGAFDDFRVEAATFYCDIEPVLRRAYDGVLERLDK